MATKKAAKKGVKKVSAKKSKTIKGGLNPQPIPPSRLSK
jgi:hypothetical protein